MYKCLHMIEFIKIFEGNKTTVKADNLSYPKTETPMIEFCKVVLPAHSMEFGMSI